MFWCFKSEQNAYMKYNYPSNYVRNMLIVDCQATKHCSVGFSL